MINSCLTGSCIPHFPRPCLPPPVFLCKILRKYRFSKQMFHKALTLCVYLVENVYLCMNYGIVRSFRYREGRCCQHPAPTLRICRRSVLSPEGTPLPLLKGTLLCRLDAEVRCCECSFFSYSEFFSEVTQKCIC